MRERHRVVRLPSADIEQTAQLQPKSRLGRIIRGIRYVDTGTKLWPAIAGFVIARVIAVALAKDVRKDIDGWRQRRRRKKLAAFLQLSDQLGAKMSAKQNEELPPPPTATLTCRIWYSISRTVSDDDVHRGDMMIARPALSPSSPAPAARSRAALGLDRLARPSKSGDRAANALTTMLR